MNHVQPIRVRYWEPVFEDSINLIAKLPTIAAAIYRWGGAAVQCSMKLFLLDAR